MPVEDRERGLDGRFLPRRRLSPFTYAVGVVIGLIIAALWIGWMFAG